MTLKELRGKWLREIQDLTPDVIIPDANALIREAVRSTIKPCGGIQRTATIITVSGTREYNVATGGFPTDFMRVYRVYDNTSGYILDPCERRDRNDASRM